MISGGHCAYSMIATFSRVVQALDQAHYNFTTRSDLHVRNPSMVSAVDRVQLNAGVCGGGSALWLRRFV